MYRDRPLGAISSFRTHSGLCGPPCKIVGGATFQTESGLMKGISIHGS